MFNFKNINKLFSYNWSSIIKKMVPKGNKMVVDEQSYNNIKNGAILRIISIAFSKIAAIGLAIWVVVDTYKEIFGNNIMSYAITTTLKENAGNYIGQIVGACILPIAILVYTIVMRKKQQNSWPYFIVLIYTLVYSAYSLWGILGWFASLITSPVFALIGLTSLLLTLLGNVHIAVGCIDFCLALSPADNNYTQNQGVYSQPNTFVNQGISNPNVSSNLSQPNQYGYNNSTMINQDTTNNVNQSIVNQNIGQPNIQNSLETTNVYQQPIQQNSIPNQNTFVQPEAYTMTPQSNIPTQHQEPFVDTNAQQPNVTNGKICPNCNTQSEDSANVCYLCGYRF